jgi:SAM-dependent methyltransferase
VTGYAFPNAWEAAQRRLELLEACHDPSSIRRAQALGVAPGWRCLDAGAGGGSFARWLARRGADVLAVDLDVRLLERIPTPGLEVRQMNVVTDELPTEAFDLVHTRLLLIHVPEREEVLRKLVASLRPGGVLMIEEDDIYPLLSTASGAYRAGWEAFLKRTSQSAVHPTWARTLPEQLDALGLHDVDAEVDTQLFRGRSAPAEFWSLTWFQVRDETDSEAIDAGRAALDDPAGWYYGPAKIIAWGRRGPR